MNRHYTCILNINVTTYLLMRAFHLVWMWATGIHHPNVQTHYTFTYLHKRRDFHDFRFAVTCNSEMGISAVKRKKNHYRTVTTYYYPCISYNVLVVLLCDLHFIFTHSAVCLRIFSLFLQPFSLSSDASSQQSVKGSGNATANVLFSNMLSKDNILWAVIFPLEQCSQTLTLKQEKITSLC